MRTVYVGPHMGLPLCVVHIQRNGLMREEYGSLTSTLNEEISARDRVGDQQDTEKRFRAIGALT